MFAPLFIAACLVLTARSVGALFGLQVGWFFYALVLVFLGGIIVLVLYVAALRENEKFRVSPHRTKIRGAGFFVRVFL